MMPARRDIKGKGRAFSPRDQDQGGTNGSLVDLTLLGDGISVAVYALPVKFGSGASDVYVLQVDIGSSDSVMGRGKLCSSSSCSSSSIPKYDPSRSSSSVDTAESFSMSYLRGSVSGEIYWDTLQVGSYNIENQAFAVASQVIDEELSIGYSGLLGLAFPLNSKIAQSITPTDGNAPDGAPIASNVFGMGSEAPTEHFFSILLERPSMPGRIPSLLGIGMHPLDVIPDPTEVIFTTVAAYPMGTLLWSIPVTNFSVYVNGVGANIPLGRSKANPNNAFPMAVLDTGVPFIFARSDVTNAVYGAYGVSPATDGTYYVPCTTPMNISISLGLGTYPIHPLDLTFPSSKVLDQSLCVGALQAAALTTADLVLGVAFLRNVYTVLSYNRRGSIEYANSTAPTNSAEIGLFSLTNITQALQEFHIVRVDQMPLPSPSGGNPTSHGTGSLPSYTRAPNSNVQHGIPVGISVVIGVLSFFGACIIVFLARCFIVRRKLKVAPPPAASNAPDAGHSDGAIGVGKAAWSGDSSDGVDKPATLVIAVPRRKKSRWGKGDPSGDIDEETLRSIRWSEWRQSTHYSRASMMTASTNVGEWTDPDELGDLVPPHDGGEGGPISTAMDLSRSRSHGRRGVIYPPAAFTHTHLAVRPDGLANIPTLEEITPESLLSHFPPMPRPNPAHTHSASPSGSGSSSADERDHPSRGRSPLRSTPIPPQLIQPWIPKYEPGEIESSTSNPRLPGD
ncbi:hypothetical protein BS47DRAFT_1335325 [Hydnum rufescens UP504]|uniref:Peptidase A1 domain-containing protein n=1 Tax=Hydnum rufescens UP504 TaxID=1448309 RepID=A0A9P6BD41_9AGAM|nr:hypothetical protein BS47DRAFT_1335325 [Hydnum rufescens UP504]